MLDSPTNIYDFLSPHNIQAGTIGTVVAVREMPLSNPPKWCQTTPYRTNIIRHHIISRRHPLQTHTKVFIGSSKIAMLIHSHQPIRVPHLGTANVHLLTIAEQIISFQKRSTLPKKIPLTSLNFSTTTSAPHVIPTTEDVGISLEARSTSPVSSMNQSVNKRSITVPASPCSPELRRKKRIKIAHLVEEQPPPRTKTTKKTVLLETRTQTKDSASSKKKVSKWYAKSTPLGANFVPDEHDVICARGNAAFNHKGNRFFRDLVATQACLYRDATSKSKRSTIVSTIIRAVRGQGNAGFVKQFNDGTWIEVGDALAREKVCQMMRNHVGAEYKSSLQGKKVRKELRKSNNKNAKLHDLMMSNDDVKMATKNLGMVAENPVWSEASCTTLFDAIMSDMLDAIKKDNPLRERFNTSEAKLRVCHP